MFESANIDAVQHKDPWDLSLKERMQMLAGGEKRVVYFYDDPDAATFRYRVFNMVEALTSGNDTIRASWFHRGDLLDVERMTRVMDQADALVLCRTRYSPAVGRLVTHAKRRNIRVIFDTDDLIFDPDFTRLILNTIGMPENDETVLDAWYAYAARQGALLRLCDRVITTNDYLGERVKAFAPHVAVRTNRNFLNRQQQILSTKLYEQKRQDNFRSSAPIQIGYFSGSPSHARDFGVASQALARLMEADSRLRLTLVGFLDEGPELKKYADRIERHPFQDYMNLQRLIAKTEINIAPLIDNVFTNCKSELKFFEAAIVGTLTVASPTFVFAHAIHDEKTGFLAKAHEWDEKLEKAVSLVLEPDRYAAMAAEAFAYAETHYGWNQQRQAIEASIFD